MIMARLNVSNSAEIQKNGNDIIQRNPVPTLSGTARTAFETVTSFQTECFQCIVKCVKGSIRQSGDHMAVGKAN